MEAHAKGWLNLGYLTDNALVLRVRDHKKRLEEKAGADISMSSVIRSLIKTALQLEEEKIHGSR